MNDKMKSILLSLINQARENKEHEVSYDLISIAQNKEQVRSIAN